MRRDKETKLTSMKLFLLIVTCLTCSQFSYDVTAFVPNSETKIVPSTRNVFPSSSRRDISIKNNNDDVKTKKTTILDQAKPFLFAAGLTLASWTSIDNNMVPSMIPPAYASDSNAIVKCLFKNCKIPLAKCIANPKCLANVICINTCNGKEDEIGCQIQCGDLFENDVVGEFNKCVVTDMKCVPKQQDDGSYPVPPKSQLLQKFDTKFFDEKLYITAGQNPLFDIFPCQVHFFKETEPGKIFGKLNWRIEEPDGEYFNRDAIQRFVQDPDNPAHLVNHDNEYLHYEDDWYIVDAEQRGNKDGVPPFAFVYYRGNNDAWEGYGGAVVYTPAAKLPEELIPRLRIAAEKVNLKWDDFVITDNSCTVMEKGEAILLREKFAGKVALQTEKQAQAAATRFRGNGANSVLAQKIFFENGGDKAGKAFTDLSNDANTFEESQRAKVSTAVAK